MSEDMEREEKTTQEPLPGLGNNSDVYRDAFGMDRPVLKSNPKEPEMPVPSEEASTRTTALTPEQIKAEKSRIEHGGVPMGGFKDN